MFLIAVSVTVVDNLFVLTEVLIGNVYFTHYSFDKNIFSTSRHQVHLSIIKLLCLNDREITPACRVGR